MDDTQKLFKLKSDIQTKERELKKLTEEVENLQSTKGAAFMQLDVEIRKRKNELEVIQSEGRRLQLLMKLYSEAVLDLKKLLAEKMEILDNIIMQLTKRRYDLQQVREEQREISEKLISSSEKTV